MDRDEEQRRRRGEHTRSYSQDRPIGSGENAKSLVRGVKQWLPDIPGSVGDMADMLYAGGANVLQGQKQRSIAPLGAGPAIRRAIGKRAPLEQVEMRATPETDWWEEGARFANPAAFMSPKNIAGLGGLALAGGVPGAATAVVKPRGGNWYTGSGSEMESAIKSLLKGQDGRRVSGVEGSALNKWLEGTLQRYVKRDMATEADPIRKLLEQDPPVSHMRPRELDAAANEDYIPFVQDFLRQSPAGKWGEIGESPENLGFKTYEEAKKYIEGYAQGGLVGRQEFNGAVGYILD